MELKDTIELMNSKDYKDRFKAEYHQTKIRHDKLKAMIEAHGTGKLDFTPTSSVSLLRRQLSAMKQYLVALELRAKAEGIDLEVAM